MTLLKPCCRSTLPVAILAAFAFGVITHPALAFRTVIDAEPEPVEEAPEPAPAPAPPPYVPPVKKCPVPAEPPKPPMDRSACYFPVGSPEELIGSDYVENARHNFCTSPAGALSFAEGDGQVIVRAPIPGKIGAHANSTGYVVGGYYEDYSGSYGDWLPRPEFDSCTGEGLIRSLADLEAALKKTEDEAVNAIKESRLIPRQTIWIPSGADIEIGDKTLMIWPGVTLASGRGRGIGADRAFGGVIRSSVDKAGQSIGLRIVSQAEVLALNPDYPHPLSPTRVTGLRLIGPNPYEDPPDLVCHGLGAIGIYGDEGVKQKSDIVDRVVEIDNNEFSSWPETAVRLQGINGGFIHHNYIHHSQRHAQGINQLGALCGLAYLKVLAKPFLHTPEQKELVNKLFVDGYGWHAKGYGVSIDNGLFYVEANSFYMNRHSIASAGNEFTQYIAMYNELSEDGPSHHFDVHGGQDRGDGFIAGGTIVIGFNTDMADDEDSINIRGNPAVGAWITGNSFRGSRDSVKQTKTPSRCEDINLSPQHRYSSCISLAAGVHVLDDNWFDGSGVGLVGIGGPRGGGGNGPGDGRPPVQQQ